MILPFVLALAAAAGSGPGLSGMVEVTSDSACPSAERVRAALDALDSPAPARRAAVTVRSRDDGLLLEFAWEGHGPADTRALAAPRDCGARADAAAVVVATWLRILPPAPVPDAPTPAVPPPPALEVRALPAQATDARGFWLGVGLGASGGGGVAPGARIEIARARSSWQGLAWIASVQASLPRSREIGGGTSRWIRPAVGLAAAIGWRVGSVGIAADLGPLAAVTAAWGDGYPSDRTDQALVFGLSGGLRLQLGAGPSRPWVEVRLIDWLGTQRLRFESPGAAPITADLPSLEGLLTLGWSLPIP